MPRSDRWKPCDALRPEDFERHPLWGFDLSREADPEADETWVRPWTFEKAPEQSDCLFVAAKLRFSSGERAPGAVVFRFSEQHAEIQDVVLLSPAYLTTDVSDDDFRDVVEARLTAALGRPVEAIYPVEYEAVIPVGGYSIELRGAVRRASTP